MGDGFHTGFVEGDQIVNEVHEEGRFNGYDLAGVLEIENHLEGAIGSATGKGDPTAVSKLQNVLWKRQWISLREIPVVLRRDS